MRRTRAVRVGNGWIRGKGGGGDIAQRMAACAGRVGEGQEVAGMRLCRVDDGVQGEKEHATQVW